MSHVIIRENIPQYMQELRAWLQTQEDQPLEEMAAFFQAHLGEYEAHMSLWQPAYQRLAEWIPADARTLLDLGCGTGLELDAILALRPELSVTGIDLCADMLARLQAKHPKVQTLCGDYFQTELGTEVYDCVVSVESLHHFRPEQKLGLYRRIFQALRPGGVFWDVDYLACCPEEESLLAEFCMRARSAQGIPAGTFVHFDTPLTTEHEQELLQNAGFPAPELTDCIQGAGFLRCQKPRF